VISVRYSSVLAVAVFLGLVPATVAIAFAGHRADLYPRLAAPVVFGVLFAVSIGAVFAVLPVVRRRFDH